MAGIGGSKPDRFHDAILKVPAVAVVLDCSDDRVRALRERGELRMWKMGRSWVTSEAWIRRYLHDHPEELQAA